MTMRSCLLSGNNSSTEARCLLLLARGTFTRETRQEAATLAAQSVDWPQLFELAQAHGVLPSVARNLRELGWPRGVPAQLRRDVATANTLNAAQNALMARELRRLLECFDRAGVAVVPLKGVALADLLYGDITRRVCADIDLLVHRDSVSQAVEVLHAEGYRPKSRLWATSRERDLVLASDIEAAFRDSTGAEVDLHWDIARRWRADALALDDLWAETSPTTLWGAPAYRLSPEWELLYLAVHAVRHHWRALKWLIDIHDYCAVRGVDWDRLAAKADRLGWGRALRQTLAICRAVLGTAVPDALVCETPGWVLAPVQESDGGWREALLPARLLDRRVERLRYLFRLLFMPTILEHRIGGLPAPLSLVYYGLRPLRLAARWGHPVIVSVTRAWRFSVTHSRTTVGRGA